PLLELLRHDDYQVHALSHITGGGLRENLPRVLPEHLTAHVDTSRWQRPAVFDWLQQQGNVDEHEMHRVLNCGIGMVLVVPEAQADQIRAHLQAQGEGVHRIGVIAERQGDEEQVQLEQSGS
ncbi:MAG: AIR synthase-related protein, partial [Pseudomonadota bacterium]|nr:AIR synthase-related protein [Pseudomonadota bacterium]